MATSFDGRIDDTFFRSTLTARSVGIACQMGEIRELDRQEVRDLEKVMKTRNLPLCGAPGVNQSLEALYFEP